MGLSTWIVIIVFVILFLVFCVYRSRKHHAEQEKVRLKEFHEKHMLPPEKEQLMSFGALMFYRNGEMTRFVKTGRPDGDDQDLEDQRTDLIKYWGIDDERTAKEAIQGLIVRGRRAYYQSDFSQIQQGTGLRGLKSLSAADYLRWEKAKKLWEQEGLSISTSGINSLSAYDFERAALLFRLCKNQDYITEAEMWQGLAWVAEQAISEFEDWQQYAASFVLGRATTYDSQNDDTLAGIEAVKHLLFERDEFYDRLHLWQEYPLKSIVIPESLINVHQEASNETQHQLLGFASLWAWVNEVYDAPLGFHLEDPDGCKTWLANAWNIGDEKTTAELIDFLLSSGSRSEYKDTFNKIVEGTELCDLKQINADQYVNFHSAEKKLEQAGISSDSILSCNSMLAYDLERAAVIVRYAYSAGYISEEKAWGYLRQIGISARKTYESWEEYMVSFSLSQALFNKDGNFLKDLIDTGIILLKVRSPFVEYQSPWQRFPLEKMPVLHSVKRD